jgi:hypothetical protein
MNVRPNKRTLSLIKQARPATKGQPLPCLERGFVLMNRNSLGSVMAASISALWSFFSVIFLGDATDTDRRALPIPKLEATSAGGYEAPATPAEEAVAYVWRDVLGVPRVGRKDDFFALGGRSLLLPRVRHRLEQELGVRLSLASLLERTTAAALALAAEELLLDELERELAAAG